MKNLLFYLFSNIEKFEKKEKIDEPQQLSKEIYKKLLALLKEIPGLEDKYRQLNRFEKELDGILPYMPEEWGIYKRALEKDISQLYQEKLDDILKNTESLAEIKAAVHGLEEQLSQNTDIFHSILHLDSVKRNLEKMSDHLKTMDRFLEYENPWTVIQQNQLINHLETGIELLKPTVREWACFNSLETKFKFTTDVSIKTREILEKVNAFLDSVKSESLKILHFDLSLNIEQYQPTIDTIIEKTSELPRLYKKIRFLTNLEEIVQELKQIIFPASSPHPGFINEKNQSLIPSIKEEAEKGDKIYEAFKTLHAKSFEEPLKLIDEFIDIGQKNKDRGFILRNGLERSILETIGKIRRSIFDKMNDILLPMIEVLKRVYPLPSPDELDSFKNKIEAIKKKHSEINAYYQAYGVLINPHQQQLKEIDKLIEAEELIMRKKFGQAGEVIYRACAFDYPLQNQLRMVNYYYEKIHQQPWDEVIWRSFFNKYFEALADKGTQLKYREILEEYQASFKENFTRVQPDSMEEHYKILTRHLKENHMLPYIIYITDNCDVKTLCRTIHEKESVKNLFPLFLDYLVQYCMWPKYAELYKSIEASQQEIFGSSPWKLPREDLEKRYHEIKNVFLQTLTISPRLEESQCLIPPGEEFAGIKGKFKHLDERMEDFKNINHTFEIYKSINIWINDRFITELNQLKSMCSKFSHEWTPIRMQMRWEDTIQTLKEIYGKGRNLMKKFNLASDPEPQGIDFLENFETKAAIRYSEQLEFFLNQFLELWQDFNASARELTGETQTSDLKNVFNEENYKRFKEKWQTLEFHRLWVREKLPEPGNLDQFFDMFQQVLDNHKKFRECYREETVAEHLNKFKTLDPFINLMLDNLVERGLLKTRGAR